MLKEKECVTDEELQEIHETIKESVISELNSELNPQFGLEVDHFIDETKVMIAEEYQTYSLVNEAKRSDRWEVIKNESKKFINEYETKVNQNFDSIQSEEELLAKHSRVSEDVLRNTKESGVSLDKQRILIQESYVESQISNLFEEILAKFREKVGIFEEADEAILEESKLFYKNVMDPLFEEFKSYAKPVLFELQLNSRADTFKHFFESRLRNNRLIGEHLKKSYLVQLNDYIDESDIHYNRKNEENKLQFDESLKEKAKLIQQKYSQIMNEMIDSILSEDDLNLKHLELMSELLSEFTDSTQLVDKTLLIPHQESLQTFMKNELSSLQKRLNERIEEIKKDYEKKSNLLKKHYKKEMTTITKSEEILSDEELAEFHALHSEDVIKQFEAHLKEKPCAETQTYISRFKDVIEEKFNEMKDIFQTKRELMFRNLEKAIDKDFTQMYEKEMKENQIIIKTVDELEECHQKTREKIIKNFEQKYRFRDSSKMTHYLKTLEENLENSFNDLKDELEFKIEKQEVINENLKIKIRHLYNQEMCKFLQNKPFVAKKDLNECHELVLSSTIEKLSEEKEDLDQRSFQEFVEHSVEDIFTKIDEENLLKLPTKSIAIGIDLGTTNSCVAYYRPDSRSLNNVVVIPNLNHPTTPSVVSYRDNSVPVVGKVAKDEIHEYYRTTITSVKRLIGRNYNDETVRNDMHLWPYKVIDGGNNNPKLNLKVNNKSLFLYPEEVSAQVLRKMKEIAEVFFGCEVTKAVITVPAYFNDGQKEATKDAGKLAGLDVLRIINEPTAAAIAFKVDRNNENEIRNVLIYDFGGGTFDVSILEINRGKIIVKSVGGDNHLGGDDIDTNLIKYCLEQFYTEFNLKPEGVEGEYSMCRLRNKCEEHRKKLTSVESTLIFIKDFYRGHGLRVSLTRDKFEELNHHLFVKSINLVKTTLNDTNKNPSDIDDIVLVGGTTRIPNVQQMLKDLFGKPLNNWVNPDEAVAKGAAIQAAYINGQQIYGSTELELKDVTPLSLGIKTKSGKMSTIIPRNSPVPTTVSEIYYTSEDYQTVCEIKIFEGEKEMANDNHLLGQFDLSGIPSALQGQEPIDVTFRLNDEGILNVKAKIVSTGKNKEIEITEHRGRLTTELIQQLRAQEDFNKRLFK